MNISDYYARITHKLVQMLKQNYTNLTINLGSNSHIPKNKLESTILKSIKRGSNRIKRSIAADIRPEKEHFIENLVNIAKKQSALDPLSPKLDHIAKKAFHTVISHEYAKSAIDSIASFLIDACMEKAKEILIKEPLPNPLDLQNIETMIDRISLDDMKDSTVSLFCDDDTQGFIVGDENPQRFMLHHGENTSMRLIPLPKITPSLSEKSPISPTGASQIRMVFENIGQPKHNITTPQKAREFRSRIESNLDEGSQNNDQCVRVLFG